MVTVLEANNEEDGIPRAELFPPPLPAAMPVGCVALWWWPLICLEGADKLETPPKAAPANAAVAL